MPKTNTPDKGDQVVVPVVDNRTETKHRYVPLEEPEKWKQCYEESCAREAEANPQFRGVVKRILSGAEQLHHGRRVNNEPRKLTIGWTDEEHGK